jgi:uncharacterized protein involved in exopolysaccharide biosynthesis
MPAGIEQNILARQNLEQLIEQFGLYAPEKADAPLPERAARMRRDLAVTTNSRSVTVSFSAGDARLAQQVCAGIVAHLLKATQRPRELPSSTVGSELTAQVLEAKRKLDQQQAKLAEFKRRHGGELASENPGQAEDALMAEKAQLADIKAGLDRAAEDRTLSENLLRQQLAAWHRTRNGPTVATQALEQELATEQAQLAALEARYTRDHPDVVKLSNDIAQLQKKLDDARKSAPPPAPQNPDTVLPGEPAQVAQTRAQIRQLEHSIQEKTRERQRLEQEIQSAELRRQTEAARELEFESLTSSRNAAQSAYEALLAKQRQAEESAAAEQTRSAEFQVASPPSFPTTPSFPDPLLFTLGGAVGGIVVALLTIFTGAWSDTTLRTEADVERYLGLPTLAVIPAAGAPDTESKDGTRNSAGRRGNSGAREEGVLVDV